MAKTLKFELNEAISDEQKAPKGYYKLMDKLKSPIDKSIVQGIIHDEIRHKELLKMIKSREL